jgi:hypothetical protein
VELDERELGGVVSGERARERREQGSRMEGRRGREPRSGVWEPSKRAGRARWREECKRSGWRSLKARAEGHEGSD